MTENKKKQFKDKQKQTKNKQNKKQKQEKTIIIEKEIYI